MPNSADRNLEFQFHVEEHRSLRSEIVDSIKETRQIERLVLVGTAAIWAWLVTDGKVVPKPSYWIPVLLVFGGALRSWTLWRSVERAAAYLMEIEVEIPKFKNLPGWENWLRSRQGEDGSPAKVQNLFGFSSRDTGLLLTAIMFWIVMLVATVLFPFCLTS